MQIGQLLAVLAVTATALAGDKTPTDDIATGCSTYMAQGFKWPFCQKVKAKKNAPCVCVEEDWMVSNLACIKSLDSNPDNMKAHFKAVKTYCKKGNVTMDDIETAYAKVDDLKPLGKPLNSYKLRSVKSAFSLPREEYELGYAAYMTNTYKNRKADRYGVGMLCFWFGVIVFRSIFHWLRNVFPAIPHKVDSKPIRWLRKNFLVAPLLRFNHSTPATLGKSSFGRFFTFNLPTRQSATIVLCFFAVNLALIFASLDLVDYNYKFDNWSEQYSKLLAVRSGWLAVYTLPVMFLFAGRNNFMITMTGWPMDEFNVFHKWLGRICFADMLIHVSSYTHYRLATGAYDQMWSTPYWQWGMAAMVMMGVMVFFATHWFRKISYEIFLIIHILCAVGFIVGAYWHVKIIEDESRIFYAVWAVWAFDRAARLGRVLVASPFSRATVTYHAGHTVELTINYSKLWKVPPGSYIFVHIVQPSFFWESHPFTMMQGVKDDHQGCIKLYCRGMTGMTNKMVQKCQRNNGSFETYVWLDGPYHQYINTTAFKEALFIAGGIGITAPFSYVQGHIAKGFSDITVHWGIRDTAPLEWFASEIEYMIRHGVKLFIHVGDDSPVSSSNASFLSDNEKEKSTVAVSNHADIKQGRMNIHKIISEAADSASGPLAILTCGPGPVNDLSRQAVVANLMTSPHYIEYFEESFSW